MKSVQALVIDGFHAGHSMRIEYYPTLKLLKPRTITVDTCCGGDEMTPVKDDIIVYKECFRASDGEMVLYSTTGKSQEVLGFFPANFTDKPWTNKTTLYFGYHDGLIKRTDEDSEEK